MQHEHPDALAGETRVSPLSHLQPSTTRERLGGFSGYSGHASAGGSSQRITSDLQDVGDHTGRAASSNHDSLEGQGGHGRFPQSNFESIDLHPLILADASEKVQSRGSSSFSRFVLDVIIGVVMAAVGYCVSYGTHFFTRLRFEFVVDVIGGEPLSSETLGKVWMYNSLISLGYCIVAGAFCLWQPGAIGSGIPGVISFLNAIDVKDQVFSHGVLIAKVFGTVFACASGLAIGPEGPMIHIGATVGILVHYHASRWDWARRRLGLERSARLVELHVAAVGAGCGVTAAFGAPIAGTLFVVEEASSRFSPKFFIAVFSAGIVSVAILQLDKSELPYRSIFSVTQGQNCSIFYRSYFFACVMIGVVCGVAGWLFNKLCEQSAKARKYLRQKKGCGPLFFFLEVLLLSVLSTTAETLLPSLSPCRASTIQNLFKNSSACVQEDWAAQVFRGRRQEQNYDTDGQVQPWKAVGSNFDHGAASDSVHQSKREESSKYTEKLIPHPGLFGVQYDPQLCPIAVQNHSCRLDGQGLASFFDEFKVEPHERYFYCCGFDNLSSFKAGRIYSFRRPQAPLVLDQEFWPKFGCATKYDEDNHVNIPYYRPMAAVALVPGHAAVQNLFIRGAPGMLPIRDIMLWWPVYFVLAAVTSGSAVPCGLVVPMLFMGASLGRVCGLVLLYAQEVAPSAILGDDQCHPVWFRQFNPLLYWLKSIQAHASFSSCFKADPGTMAIVGAAAFMSASGSIVLFVIAMLVEVTADTSFTIPIAIGAIVGRAVNGLLRGHGLYHTLMRLSNLPFLGRWHGPQNSQPCLAALPKDRRVTIGPSQAELESNKLRLGNTLNTLMEQLRPCVIAADQEVNSAASQLFSELRDCELRLRMVLNRAGAATMGALDSESTEVAQARKALRKLHEEEFPSEIIKILTEKGHYHHAFPVVNRLDTLVGLVRREDLQDLLKAYEEQELTDSESSEGSQPYVEDYLRSSASVPVLSHDGKLVLTQLMDVQPYEVHYKFPIYRVHRLFQQIMLRHLVVVDSDRRPVGVITRTSLLDITTEGLARAFGS